MFLRAWVALSCVQMALCVEVPNVILNNGRQMPAIALGTYLGVDQDLKLAKSKDNEVYHAICRAIDVGYRHVDTAAIYETEREVGEAVNTKIDEGAVKRDDIFITTKLWNTRHKRKEVTEALRESLNTLGLNYVDLYLMHWPIALNSDYTYSDVDYMETWRGLEDAVTLGLARSVGVSNFNVTQLQRVLAEGEIRPVVLQIEVHPQMVQSELVSFCHSHNVTVMGHSPLGTMVPRFGMSLPGPKLDDPALVVIADEYGKTTAQVVLRWQVDRRIIPVIKSVNPRRLAENINIFDFRLTEEEVDRISTKQRLRLIEPSFWQDHKYYPFEKVAKPVADPFRKESN